MSDQGLIRGLLDDPAAIEAELRGQQDERDKEEAERKKKEMEEEKIKKKNERFARREFAKKKFFMKLPQWRDRFVALILGPESLEIDEKAGKEKWRVWLAKNMRKIKIGVTMVLVVFVLFFVWAAARLSGVIGSVRGVGEVSVNGHVVTNVYPPYTLTLDEFQIACASPKISVTKDIIEAGFFEVNIFTMRPMNVTIDSLRTLLSDNDCTSALYGGVPADMYKIRDTWFYSPRVVQATQKLKKAEFTDDLGNRADTQIPPKTLVEFMTNTGKLSSKILDPWESACFYGLQEISKRCKSV